MADTDLPEGKISASTPPPPWPIKWVLFAVLMYALLQVAYLFFTA